MTRILVLSRSVVGPKMASPGVRAYQIAGALARAMPEADVTLGYPDDHEPVAPPHPGVRMVSYGSNAEALFLAGQSDVTISRNFPPQFARLLGKTRLALDGFTPSTSSGWSFRSATSCRSGAAPGWPATAGTSTCN